MRIKEIMTSNVETIDSEANLVEASRKMRSLNVGALPVWEDDELIGMITDRDIMVRSVAEDKMPSITRVKEIMTSNVCCCFEDDGIGEAAKMMEKNSIHRLLVVNGSNQPSGFVSLSDLAVKSRNEHLAYEVLEKISEPACPQR